MSDLQPAVTFPALGTTAVLLVDGQVALGPALGALESEIDAIDRACSRFRPDSELSAVNAARGGAVPASALFVAAVEVALRAARLTDGLVDPTVGTAMRVLGYDRDFAGLAASGPAVRVTVGPVPGWRLVQVDHRAMTVTVPAGVELDLGATAKALCADRAATAAAAAAGTGVLVSLGGDIAVGGATPAGGWPVRVADHHAAPPDAPGQTVVISAGGLATSGVSVRRWVRGGDQLHHLIDPGTGRPAGPTWRTVSVAAGSCVDANTASTASILLGRAAPEWLAQRGLPARLVGADGQVVLAGDWPGQREPSC
jgi:thiamine biosynthesis lipoprotein